MTVALARGGERLATIVVPSTALMGLALVVGAVARLAPALSASFPLNDGGMFLVMIRDVQRAGFHLPPVTSYNGLGIPFDYPPLGFYVGAALSSLTSANGTDVLRVVPAVLTGCALGAFALLARETLDGWSAAVATLLFAVLPGGYAWEIMGGGLTRAPGMLFALLALWQAHRFYTRPSRAAWLLMVAFSSATLLSHLDWAVFLAVSVLALFMAYGRHRQGIVSSGLAAVSILAVTSPWWATVLLRHGVAPFLAASQTGSWVSLLVADADELSRPLVMAIVVAAIGLLAAISSLRGRPFLFIGWYCLITVSDFRAYAQLIAIPTALGAGYLVGALVAWARRRWRLDTGSTDSASDFVRRGVPGNDSYLNDAHPPPQPSPARGEGARDSARGMALLQRAAGAVALLLVAAGLSANLQLAAAAPGMLATLPPSDRDAMRWISTATAPDSRFIVIPSVGWALDRDNEWFPALSARQSVTTVQGTEWLPGTLQQVVETHTAARRCAAQDASCLDVVAAGSGEAVTHVFLPSVGGTGCCPLLREELSADPRYELVFEDGGTAVFARHAPQ